MICFVDRRVSPVQNSGSDFRFRFTYTLRLQINLEGDCGVHARNLETSFPNFATFSGYLKYSLSCSIINQTGRQDLGILQTEFVGLHHAIGSVYWAIRFSTESFSNNQIIPANVLQRSLRLKDPFEEMFACL